MRYPRSTHRTATLVAALLIGSTPGLASNTAHAGEYVQEDPVTTSESSDRQPRDNEGREVADTTTNASASATASSSSSSSSSSKGNGDCVAESSASARARAGHEQDEDHDSARQVSRDGDCEARSSSKASARTGGSPSGKADEE